MLARRVKSFSTVDLQLRVFTQPRPRTVNGDDVLEADELASPFLNEEARQKDIAAADTE
jgi:hypothetical protein